MTNIPDNCNAFPLDQYDRLCFLKNIISNPQIQVGDYTYYDDFKDVYNFEKNVKYLFDFIGDRLWKDAMENKSYPDKKDTNVGNDVWIGFGSTIMPGVTIGDGAIIAAKSIVTKDVDPYTIVGGNPAKPIRQRFDSDKIELLLKLQWWDWSIKKITKHVQILTGVDWEKLSKLYDEQAT